MFKLEEMIESCLSRLFPEDCFKGVPGENVLGDRQGSVI